MNVRARRVARGRSIWTEFEPQARKRTLSTAWLWKLLGYFW